MERARFAGTVLGAKMHNDPVVLIASLDAARRSTDRGLIAIYVEIMQDDDAPVATTDGERG